MNGAQQLLGILEAHGVDTVFGYPGGAIMPVYDALVGSSLRHVLVRHEQAAAFAAEGWARSTGRLGVCMATSGPGATNLVTGLADALLDSVPLLAITGQVATGVMGTDAFQEVDVFGMTLPVVKHSFVVRDVADLAACTSEAIATATEGRPGPVLIDLPKDVAMASVPPGIAPAKRAPEPPPPPDESALTDALDVLRAARRPLVYAGGGVALGDALSAFRRFIAVSDLPTVCTLKGLGVLPGDHPRALGMLGMHGTRAANLAVQSCDLLLVVGARFDDRATGRLEGFAPNARVVHLDVDPAEVGKLRRADVRVLGDLRASLHALSTPLAVDAWRARCAEVPRELLPSPESTRRIGGPAFLRALSRAAHHDAIWACDVGQHQMWVAQHVVHRDPKHHLTSGGLGAMGFGLPAAIGASLAHPGREVWCVSGDGSIMMNPQEFVTAARERVPVRTVILDNSMLGMVRQWQDLFFEGRRNQVELSDNPDFCALARACGVEAFELEHPNEVPHAIARLKAARGPIVCRVHIDSAADVWPLVPPGATNDEMLENMP